jgi:hypothetical protein
MIFGRDRLPPPCGSANGAPDLQQLGDLAPQRGNLPLELQNPRRQVSRRPLGRGRWSAFLLVEQDPDLVPVAPNDAGLVALAFVGNMQLYHTWRGDGARKLKLCAMRGKIPDQTVDAGAPVVEVDAALQKGLLA